jgi:hypothetical protein
MVVRILVAGFPGGNVMFIWTSIAHTALPLAKMASAKVRGNCRRTDAAKAQRRRLKFVTYY